jgi:hypothetical protein
MTKAISCRLKVVVIVRPWSELKRFRGCPPRCPKRSPVCMVVRRGFLLHSGSTEHAYENNDHRIWRGNVAFYWRAERWGPPFVE